MLVSYLLTPVVLVAFHWLAFRWLRQPPPLFSRTLPVDVRRTLAIGLAGAVFAYLVPVTFFFVSLTTEGVQEGLLLDPVPGRPAEAAGLEHGDEAVALDGEPLTSFFDLASGVKSTERPEVELVVERDGKRTTLVIPKDEGGIGARQLPQTLGFGQAAGRALMGPPTVMRQWFLALPRVFRRTSADITGPVGVVRAVQPTQAWGALGALLSVQLVQVLVLYLLVLVLDTRARLSYQRRIEPAAP